MNELSSTPSLMSKSTNSFRPPREWSIRKRVVDFMDLEKGIRNDPLYHFKPKEFNKESKEDYPEKYEYIINI